MLLWPFLIGADCCWALDVYTFTESELATVELVTDSVLKQPE